MANYALNVSKYAPKLCANGIKNNTFLILDSIF